MDQTPNKSILIVDDEPVILQVLRAVFEGEPYTITTVETGTEAKKHIQTVGCDILVTDKNLPDLSGLDLLQVAKETNDLTEVIIVTGYASIETAIAAMELQAFDYVIKPLNNVFEIRTKVRKAIEKQNMAIENRWLLAHLQEKNAELEAALQETKALQAELIQSEKLAGIGTLAAGIAHEVSSPLFGIMGLGEAIVDEQDITLIREFASDIVVDLTRYSRTESNEYLTTVEFPAVIDDAILLVERSASVDSVVFETDYEGDEIYLPAKANEIQQVFVNLLKNAAEAVMEKYDKEPGGKVSVRLWKDGHQLMATVMDNGPGLKPEQIPIIFDPFYTTKPPGKGTGLGLNVVYRILTKYRGSISVDADVKGGTVFRLQIPLPQ